MKKVLSIILTLVMILGVFGSTQAQSLMAEEDAVNVLDMSVANEIKVHLDQERQKVEGFILSGAFRQADHLLNGLAEYPELQKEVLDLVFGTEGKGIGLSIWRNMIGDQAEVANYRWSTYGRWFDGPVPTFKTERYGSQSSVGEDGISNFDGNNYRWWFDATELPDWSGEDIPASGNGLPTLRQIDPLQQTREGGEQGNSVFDQFDWPELPGNANMDVVGRNGRAPIDRGQVWAMKVAQQYAKDRGEEMRFISSMWSAPAWMKITGDTYRSGRNWFDPSITGIDPEYYEDFAIYLADYVEAYEKIYGLPMWGISMSNEPGTMGGAYSSSFWSPEQYEYVMREYVGPEFEKRGLTDKVRLQIGDNENYNTNYFKPFWNNDTNPNHYDDYIFHSYGASSSSGSMVNNDDNRELKVRAQTSGKGVYETEISTMSGQSFRSWDYTADGIRNANGRNQPSTMGVALGWGQKWMRQMGILETNALAQWWAWGFKNPEPEWPEIPADQSLENLIYIVNDCQGQNGGMTTPPGRPGNEMTGSVKPDYRVHKVFWAFGHFCKFVRPDWHRVSSFQTPVYEQVNQEYLNVMTTAYRSPTPDENGYYDFSIVTFNGTRDAQDFDISFPGYTVESMTPWRTLEDGTLDNPERSGTVDGENMVKLDPIALNANGVTSIKLEPVSMYTFVGKAKLNDNYTVDATSVIPGYNYNSIDGYAIYNNARDLDDPRVETLPIPVDGTNQQWSNDTYAAITYDNINFGNGLHDGVNRLILNVGGPSQGGNFNGEVPIKVYAGNELISVPDQTIQTSGTRTDQVIPVKWTYGVHDLTIELGAEDSNVRTRLNELQFTTDVVIEETVLSLESDTINRTETIQAEIMFKLDGSDDLFDITTLNAINPDLSAEVDYFSSCPLIASVDKNGTVTGMTQGETDIEAIVTYNDEVLQTEPVALTVLQLDIDAVPVSLFFPRDIIEINEEMDITLKVEDADDLYSANFMIEYDDELFDIENVVVAKDIAEEAGVFYTVEDGLLNIVFTFVGEVDGISGDAELINIAVKAKTKEDASNILVLKESNITNPYGDMTELDNDTVKRIAVANSDITGGGLAINDLVLVARAFGTVEEDSGYNPRLDMNKDGVIDITDIAYVADRLLRR